MDDLMQPKASIDHKTFLEKTTTCDEQKRYRLTKKLISQSAENFREIDINEYDLNITETFQELQYIDDAVTPLIYCAHHGLKEITKCLLKNKKIDVDMQTNTNKQTPLIVACICGNYEIVRLLLLANAQVNKPNAMNQHPLTVTLFRLIQEPPTFENKRICFKIAELLLSRGADSNWIIDKGKGYSLLHYLCASKVKMTSQQKQINFQLIKFLCQNGANFKQKTLQDLTVRDLIKNHCNRQQIEAYFTKIETNTK